MNPWEALIGFAALIGISILDALGKVDSAVVTTVYGAVLGGAIGYIRGKANGTKENGK